MLAEAGYRDVNVSPRMVYVDASGPALVDGFTGKTFTAPEAPDVAPESVVIMRDVMATVPRAGSCPQPTSALAS